MKDKTILCLYGSAGSGKTKTIINIAKLFLNKKECKISFSHFFHDENARIINADSLSEFDFRLVIEIDNIVIGFESRGDPNTELEVRLNELRSEYKCDIIICASRTRGETPAAINAQSKYGFSIIWSTTYQSYGENLSHDELNNIRAIEIFNMLQSNKVIKIK